MVCTPELEMGHYVAEEHWRWGIMWQRTEDCALCDRGELEMGHYVTEENWRWGIMWQRRTGDGALCDRWELEMWHYVTEENWRWGNMWQRRTRDGALCDRGELEMGHCVTAENWRWALCNRGVLEMGIMWQRRTGDGELCDRGELERGHYVKEENWRWGIMWQRRIGDGALCDRELEMGHYVTGELEMGHYVTSREQCATECNWCQRRHFIWKTSICRCIWSVTVSAKVWRLKCDTVKSIACLPTCQIDLLSESSGKFYQNANCHTPGISYEWPRHWASRWCC